MGMFHEYKIVGKTRRCGNPKILNCREKNRTRQIHYHHIKECPAAAEYTFFQM